MKIIIRYDVFLPVIIYAFNLMINANWYLINSYFINLLL